MMRFTTKLGAALKMAVAAALGLAALGQPGLAAGQDLPGGTWGPAQAVKVAAPSPAGSQAGGGYDAPVGKIAPATLEVFTVSAAASSAVELYATLDTAQYGDEQAETFTAIVTSPAGGTPTGTVAVSSGTTELCTITLAGDGAGMCSLAATQLPSGTYQVTAAYSGDANYSASASAAMTITVLPPAFGFVSDGPLRILDTRDGLGGHSGPVGAGQAIGLQITGSNGIPASRVTSVVLNVTAVNPTAASSYVTIYPDGQPRPVASNLNFTKGQTVPNLVTVPVGADGKIDLYNYNGTVNLIADLAGYYILNGGSYFVPDGPVRVLDTRKGTGGWNTPVGGGQAIGLPVLSLVPSGVTAVVLNVTAVNPTASGYVTVSPDGGLHPATSSLNFTKGQTVANLVVVPVPSDGIIGFYNNTGTVNLIADLAGYYLGGAGPTAGVGSSFVAAGPVRVLDTRNGTGGTRTPVAANKAISVRVTGTDGVPATGVTAVVLNVTAVNPTASSYITVFPDGLTRPVVSNLNVAAGQTVANLVTVPVGADGKVVLYNYNGSVSLIADLAGYYLKN